MSRSAQSLRVAIADDEAPARNRIRDLLEDCAATMALEVVGEAATGESLLELLQATPADVVLLDIRMPEMDGIEAAGHIQKLPEPPAVIFTTAYDSYALKAFELHALDYLVKPIRLRRLHDALSRARSITPLSLDILHELSPEPRKHLSVQERGRVILVPVDQIVVVGQGALSPEQTKQEKVTGKAIEKHGFTPGGTACVDHSGRCPRVCVSKNLIHQD